MLKSGWPRRTKRLMLPAALALGLLGCAGSIAVPPKVDFCMAYEPIRASDMDTVETLRQVDRNNAKYECACLANCPK